ncbi:MAG TPA: hypothetical protein VEJ84_19675 [Acidimicrobiales bacterium]|nr:hypothetical protein [Acidimicrobiales bacterium]
MADPSPLGEVRCEVVVYPGSVAEEENPPDHDSPPVDPEDREWLDEQLLTYEELLAYLRDH